MAKVGERVSWTEGDYRLVGELLDFDQPMQLVLVLDDEGNAKQKLAQVVAFAKNLFAPAMEPQLMAA